MINLSKTQNVTPRTLVQIMTEAEEHNGAVKVAAFPSFADWMQYYEFHYLPILEAIRDGETLSEQENKLLRFMYDDIIEMFKK